MANITNGVQLLDDLGSPLLWTRSGGQQMLPGLLYGPNGQVISSSNPLAIQPYSAAGTPAIAETLGAAAGMAVSEDILRYMVLHGKAYTVSTGKQTASAAGNFPTQFLCSSIAKYVLLVSIIAGGTTTGFTLQLNSITADSGWTGNTAITANILNLSLGGAVSSVSSVLYNLTTQTLGGAATILATATSGANGTLELLQNGIALLLPANAANGLVVWNSPTGASTFHTTFKWLEI